MLCINIKVRLGMSKYELSQRFTSQLTIASSS